MEFKLLFDQSDTDKEDIERHLMCNEFSKYYVDRLSVKQFWIIADPPKDIKRFLKDLLSRSSSSIDTQLRVQI